MSELIDDIYLHTVTSLIEALPMLYMIARNEFLDQVDLYRAHETLGHDLIRRLAFNVVLNQAMGGFVDQDGVWFSHGLQARGQG